MNALSLSNTHNMLKANNLETHSHPLNGLILPNLTKKISEQIKIIILSIQNLWQRNRFSNQADFHLALHQKKNKSTNKL